MEIILFIILCLVLTGIYEKNDREEKSKPKSDWEEIVEEKCESERKRENHRAYVNSLK